MSDVMVGKWAGDSGLMDDYEFEIQEARFVSTQFGTQLQLTGTAVEETGEVHPEYLLKLSCGKKFEPRDSGERAVNIENEAKGFNSNSTVQKFIVAAAKSGAPLQERSDDPCVASMWVGLRFRINLETGSFTDDTGAARTFNTPVPTYLGEGASSGIKARSNGSAAAANEPDIKKARAEARRAEDFGSWYSLVTDALGFDANDARVAETGADSIWQAIRGDD